MMQLRELGFTSFGHYTFRVPNNNNIKLIYYYGVNRFEKDLQTYFERDARIFIFTHTTIMPYIILYMLLRVSFFGLSVGVEVSADVGCEPQTSMCLTII